MMFRHLRHNAVAYLALAIAISTSTAYAVGISPGSVTTKALAKNAVTSPKIKNGSVTVQDLKPGTIPTIPTIPTLPVSFLSTQMAGAETPGATPDNGNFDPYPFTLPAAGEVYIRYFSGLSGITCSSGTGVYGMYVDGAPVPLGGHFAPTFASAIALTLTATTTLSAGPHTLSFAFDCPTGAVNQSTRANTSWTVLMVG